MVMHEIRGWVGQRREQLVSQLIHVLRFKGEKKIWINHEGVTGKGFFLNSYLK